MVEINNDTFFQSLYQECPLDEVIVALDLARVNQYLHRDSEIADPILMNRLHEIKVVKDDDSIAIGLAKVRTLNRFYREHRTDCVQAIFKYYGF